MANNKPLDINHNDNNNNYKDYQYQFFTPGPWIIIKTHYYYLCSTWSHVPLMYQCVIPYIYISK